jgi:hypothetical protein
MNETEHSMPASDTAARQRRLELARKAFKEFYAQCFWSYREDAEITEDKIPFVIRGLREHGGLAGYQIAAELCHFRAAQPKVLALAKAQGPMTTSS